MPLAGHGCRRNSARRSAWIAAAALLHAQWQALTLSTPNALSRWAAAALGDMPVALACNDFELIQQSIALGLGIGLLPADCVNADDGLVPVALHAPTPEVHESPLHLVMHEDVRRSPSVRAVADFLVQALAQGEEN
ncbi:LysR substrate-binding domain-containing protein [Vandammella animalimorsus]|uniref:LysR substrate-binding domain-containing protein n=1 Tax=Vandammella animalimorsus TaxID=2029117 RepID=A0A2A2AXD8_9BURK|nr:LysR substrate-binding domain-containing protein [Vandammella animalimorsus]PAT42401.1 hypothetical protein CK621_09505 [Vandammella animalimorsus]RRD57579.1 hypothetical protein EII20_05920 [Comamonadaceae bacterium OH2545_COT-014]